MVLALVIAIVLIGVVIVVVVRGAKRYYALSPGTAPRLTTTPSCHARSSASLELVLPDGSPCARLTVPAARSNPIQGKLLMVDVLVGPATPLEYLLDRVGLLHRFHDGMQLVPVGEILGTTPASQLGCQDTQQMSGATDDAAVVALRRLGYQVGEKDQGAQIDVVQPGSPAAAAGLHCNDVVTAVGTAAVSNSGDLVHAIRQHRPGDAVLITVQRSGAHGALTAHVLTAHLSGTPAVANRGAADPAKPFLGVTSESRVTYQLPFEVSIDVGGIGGPSAGLSLTLGLLDVLSGGHLTGGHNVAATGTINLDGTVGDVGGVAQKTVAVRRAGAQLFLVPKDELASAQSEAGPNLKVVPVATLGDALAAVQRVGGHVPAPATAPSA